MEKISLDQCFLKDCDNQDPKLVEPFKKEQYEEDKKEIKKIHIKCKKCNGIFILKLETLKYVAKSTKNEEEQLLSMDLIYILDENEDLLGFTG